MFLNKYWFVRCLMTVSRSLPIGMDGMSGFMSRLAL